MSAEILRRAAGLMRERAEAATPGPWTSRRGPREHVVSTLESVATIDSLHPREDRRHIASWHPAVALAVAEWLDYEAQIADGHAADGYTMGPQYPGLLLARAYLGEQS